MVHFGHLTCERGCRGTHNHLWVVSGHLLPARNKPSSPSSVISRPTCFSGNLRCCWQVGSAPFVRTVETVQRVRRRLQIFRLTYLLTSNRHCMHAFSGLPISSHYKAVDHLSWHRKTRIGTQSMLYMLPGKQIHIKSLAARLYLKS